MQTQDTALDRQGKPCSGRGHQARNLAMIAEQDICATRAGDPVSAIPTQDDVIAGTGGDGVIATTHTCQRGQAVQLVVHHNRLAEITEDTVIAAGRRDRVGTFTAEDNRATGAKGNRITLPARLGERPAWVDLPQTTCECQLGTIPEDHAAGTCAGRNDLISGTATHEDVAARARRDPVNCARTSGAECCRQSPIPGGHVCRDGLVTKDDARACTQGNHVRASRVQRLDPSETSDPVKPECAVTDDDATAHCRGDGVGSSTTQESGFDCSAQDRVIGRTGIHQNMATRLLAQIDQIGARDQCAGCTFGRKTRIQRMIALAVTVKHNPLCAADLRHGERVIACTAMHEGHGTTGCGIRGIGQIDNVEAIIATSKEDFRGLEALGEHTGNLGNRTNRGHQRDRLRGEIETRQTHVILACHARGRDLSRQVAGHQLALHRKTINAGRVGCKGTCQGHKPASGFTGQTDGAGQRIRGCGRAMQAQTTIEAFQSAAGDNRIDRHDGQICRPGSVRIRVGREPGREADRGLIDECRAADHDRGNHERISPGTNQTGHGATENNMVGASATKDLGQRTCTRAVQMDCIIAATAIDDDMVFGSREVHSPPRTAQAGLFQQDHIGALRAVEFDAVHITAGHQVDLGVEQVPGCAIGFRAIGKAAQDDVVLTRTAFDPQVGRVGIDLDPVSAGTAADQRGMRHTRADPAAIGGGGDHTAQRCSGNQIRCGRRTRAEDLAHNDVVVAGAGFQNGCGGIVLEHNEVIPTKGLEQKPPILVAIVDDLLGRKRRLTTTELVWRAMEKRQDT